MAQAASFSKKIGKSTLKITGPSSFIWKGKRILADKSKQLKVSLSYGDLKVRANRASYDLKKGSIELSEGFKGKLEDYSLEGDYFRINPKTGNYSGYDLKFGYLGAYFYGKEVQFYGNKISIEKIAASPLQYPIFRLYTEKLEIYPGYSLASRNTLKFFAVPFYFIPLYINEGRRSYFELPFPAPEVKSDIFHNLQAAVHSHYFINPALYGDLSIHHSEQDGLGMQLQQMVRFNDYHQLELNVLDWQHGRTQAKASYELHLFANPRPARRLPFRKQQQLEEKIARIPPWVVIHSDYTRNEEIQRSIIDRYPDSSLTAYLQGIMYGHTYTITPALYYGRIKEKVIYPEGGARQDVDRDYVRTRGQVNFTYYQETPGLEPFIKKVLIGADYEHSAYEPGGSNRGRVSGSLTVRRPIIGALGLYYEAILTKTLLDYGTSPFYFENYGRLMDSGILDLYLKLPILILGNQFIYDFSNWQSYNELAYLGIKAGNNYATLQYNRRLQSWEFVFTHKEAAF